jgi:hypothetical protein
MPVAGILRHGRHKRRKIRAGIQDHTEAQKKTAPWQQFFDAWDGWWQAGRRSSQ